VLLHLFVAILGVHVWNPVDCGSRVVLVPVWLVGQCIQHSLQVREVVEVERTGYLACKRLSLGERVHGGRRELLEGIL
jgi:hypothetical protein